MNVKKIFKKLLVCTLVFMTLFNFMFSAGPIPYLSFADDPETFDDSQYYSISASTGITGVVGLLSAIANGPALILALGLKLLIMGAITAIQGILSALATAGGTSYLSGSEQNTYNNVIVTPMDIFFNQFTLIDINIFSLERADGTPINPTRGALVYSIRTNAAKWYYVFRGIALAIIVIMLVINLTKALMKNTTANQKEVAKNAIVDWVTSLALIMFMHVIIILIINLNNMFVEMIRKTAGPSISTTFNSALTKIALSAFIPDFILGWSCVAVYAILTWQTAKYLLTYIQRFLTVVLLTIISPFVPITYALDKMKGGNGQALNGWLKEMIYTVFVQVVHALIFTVLVVPALANIGTGTLDLSFLAAPVIAIISLFFVKHAEKIVKSIFGFDNSQFITNNMFSNAVNSVKNGVRAVGQVGATAAGAYFGAKSGGGISLGSAGKEFGKDLGSGAAGEGKTGIGAAIGSKLKTNFKEKLDAQRAKLTDGSLKRLSPEEVQKRFGNIAGDRDAVPMAASRDGKDGRNADSNTSDQATQGRSGRNKGEAPQEGGTGGIGGLFVGAMAGSPIGDATREIKNEQREKQEKLERVIKDSEKNSKHTKETKNEREVIEKPTRVQEQTSETNLKDDPEALASFKAEWQKYVDEMKSLKKQRADVNELYQRGGKGDKRTGLKAFNKLSKSKQAELNADANKKLENATYEDCMHILNTTDKSKAGGYALANKAQQKIMEQFVQEENRINNYKDNTINNYMGEDASKAYNKTPRKENDSIESAEEAIERVNTGRRKEERFNKHAARRAERAAGINTVDNKEAEVKPKGAEPMPLEDTDVDVEADINTEDAIKEINENPEVQAAAAEALQQVYQINGKLEIVGDATKGDVTKFAIETVNSVKANEFSKSNIDDAMAALQAEGQKAVAAYQNYMDNPSFTTASGLTDAGRQLAQLQVQARLAGLMVANVATKQTGKEKFEVTEKTSSVVEELQSRRGGRNAANNQQNEE